MLNMNSDVTAAADARFGSGAGVFPLSGVRAVVASSTGAVVARPRALWATNIPGRPRRMAQHVVLGQQVATKQDSDQHYYAPKTRIAAASGGVPGAHPAREPV
jgi:hypothetical protein